MSEEKKLVRVYKKITVEEVSVWESQKSEYTNLGKKDDKGDDVYGYVNVPNKTESSEETTVLYEQKFDDGDLDVRELTLHVNRVK